MVVTHHDLKPRYILWVKNELKIVDFGHSHLRPLIKGSDTEGASGLGTYEYHPPEFWNQDGSRSQAKYGRAFDVWAMGCIITELAILVVEDWRIGEVTKFRNERQRNRYENQKIIEKVKEGEDNSFHNNLNIVENYLGRLKDMDRFDYRQRLKGIVSIFSPMLQLEPDERPYIWEIQMDLYEILRRHDPDIPVLEGDLCVPPEPYQMRIPDVGKAIPRFETPLHRAARTKNRERTIRLWELGWPTSLPDKYGETPLHIMRSSDDALLQTLEEDVSLMVGAAKDGDTEKLAELFS